MKVLINSIRQYKKASILSPVFVAMEVLLECLLPLVMAKMIDEMTGESMEPVIRYGIVLIILALASLFCGMMSGKYSATAACGFARNLRQDLYYKIQELSFADLDRFSVSSLVTRITTDVTNVQNAYQMIIRIAIRGPLMIIISVIMCLFINPKMSLIFILLVPVLGGILFLILRRVLPVFNRIFKKYDALNNSVQEDVAGIRVVKAFVRGDHETEKFHKSAEDVCNDFTYAEKIMALNTPVMTFFIYLAIVLVSLVGARVIIESGAADLTTGGLSSLINYGVQILSALMMLSMVFVMVSMALESSRRIVEVLTYESSIKSPENGLTQVADGSIDFEHVTFRYPGCADGGELNGSESAADGLPAASETGLTDSKKTGLADSKKTSRTEGKNAAAAAVGQTGKKKTKARKAALTDINLHIRSGETIGIIGGTGSSKSSLIQLIPRLYDVSEGAVKVGGADVRSYDLESLRDSVAVVLQKNQLFSGTIRDNLRWGNPNATDGEILAASRMAQADEFVQQFPEKYDTVISQGGTNVSGGQKQRLCIARALLKKPKILILDDSTSAVDTKTDALIRRAFRSDIPDTTKIIIAQRISSVQDADRILVMQDGRIAEEGTHDELLSRGGIYREIYDSQNKAKEAV